MSDETRDTIEQARRGDKHALEHLLTRQRSQLERVAEQLLGNGRPGRVRISDLLQSTFLEVVASMSSFRGADEQAFEAFVVAILEHNVRDAGRELSTFQRTAHRGVSSPGPSPSAQVVLSDELMLVCRAMAGLSDDYRRIILYRLTRGGTHGAVARTMERSPGATRVALARARAALLLEVDRLRAEDAPVGR